MSKRVAIVGGGIGGLAAALACSRVGSAIDLFECSQAFTEVGAGIQMGPNVVRILHAWDLKEALSRVAAFPERLQVRGADSGSELGVLRLGATALQRYGAPYATIHRADLHSLLLATLKGNGDVALNLDSELVGFEQAASGVTLQTASGRRAHADLLIGADGLWSRVRQQLLDDGVPVATGHLAYRALVPQKVLPANLRSQQITVWLGPQLHVVQYPVRGGDWLNIVAVVQGHMVGDIEYWDHTANVVKLRRSMARTCAPLRELIHAIEHWRLWGLSIRAPARGPHEFAKGRVALLGDAAHPMLPYLAQGAGMAVEDAQVLAKFLQDDSVPVAQALGNYANARWQRNAQVQARAIRNGKIFHATGLMRWGRDAAMKVLGERVLDVPWLYREPDRSIS
ncbi:MAG: FAD-dependent monooxygenase [Comamonadaceae bacterium]|jgi:salicylate hydroxylase